MTNPNDAIGTNAAYNGRTSVNAFNDDLAVYSRGIMSGWNCVPSSGLVVSLGGDGSTRDVAVAEDNIGNKTTINNTSGAPVDVEIESAPGSNSRIDAIVAYVDNPPQGDPTVADNPTACGLIAVTGTASSSPVAPSDGIIRSAITSDGASGATAYYTILATITVASGTTDITDDAITAGPNAIIQAQNVFSLSDPETLSSRKSLTKGTTWTNFNTYTIPESGMYNFLLRFSGDHTGTTKSRQGGRCLIGGNEFLVVEQWSIAAWSSNNFSEGNITNMRWVEAGTVVTTQGRTQNADGYVTVSLYIQKIY